MSELLKDLDEHRSVRAYLDRPIPEEVLDAVVHAAWRAPSSFNAQEISLVLVRDAARRRRIAEIAGGQPWIAQAPVFIAVVVDYHKTSLGVRKAGRKQEIHRSVEGLVAAAVDAGIVLEALMVAAHAEGLAIVPIGGIRRDPQAMIDLLELPELTFPVVGLCMGYAAGETAQKPRMEMTAFRHDETYDGSVLQSAIDAYDNQIVEHWRRVGRANGLTWSKAMATYFGVLDTRPVAEVLHRQGFRVTRDE